MPVSLTPQTYDHFQFSVTQRKTLCRYTLRNQIISVQLPQKFFLILVHNYPRYAFTISDRYRRNIS